MKRHEYSNTGKDLPKETSFYYGDRHVCTLRRELAADSSVVRTVGYLPDGKVFAEYQGRLVKYINRDGSPLEGVPGNEYVIYSVPPWE